MTLKEYFVQGRFHSGPTRCDACRLQNITLSVHEGERLGIIDHDGEPQEHLVADAGRHLFLRPPPASTCVEGRMSSLFDVTLDSSWMPTGYENIRFRGYLQGETPKSIKEKEQEIVEFTELQEFMNIPALLHRHVRALGFTIATVIQPEILLVDQVLSVGDFDFQRKAGLARCQHDEQGEADRRGQP